jgi:hypothetical protein
MMGTVNELVPITELAAIQPSAGLFMQKHFRSCVA